jgi:hypothetical protein
VGRYDLKPYRGQRMRDEFHLIYLAHGDRRVQFATAQQLPLINSATEPLGQLVTRVTIKAAN